MPLFGEEQDQIEGVETSAASAARTAAVLKPTSSTRMMPSRDDQEPLEVDVDECARHAPPADETAADTHFPFLPFNPIFEAS